MNNFVYTSHYAQKIVDLHFMAKELHLGVEDYERLTWRERKELIQFHMECVEEAKRQQKQR